MFECCSNFNWVERNWWSTFCNSRTMFFAPEMKVDHICGVNSRPEGRYGFNSSLMVLACILGSPNTSFTTPAIAPESNFDKTPLLLMMVRSSDLFSMQSGPCFPETFVILILSLVWMTLFYWPRGLLCLGTISTKLNFTENGHPTLKEWPLIMPLLSDLILCFPNMLQQNVDPYWIMVNKCFEANSSSCCLRTAISYFNSAWMSPIWLAASVTVDLPCIGAFSS